MFPARDIANEFWAFVLNQALDPRVGEDAPRDDRSPIPARTNSRTLGELEERRSELQIELGGPNAHEKLGPNGSGSEIWRSHDESGYPVGYRTLQEALIAFLVNSAALSRLNFSLGVWRCTVPVILTDAIRNPDRLRVILRDVEMASGEHALDDPEYQFELVMTISDDWSCLTAETFDHIVATYTGKG